MASARINRIQVQSPGADDSIHHTSCYDDDNITLQEYSSSRVRSRDNSDATTLEVTHANITNNCATAATASTAAIDCPEVHDVDGGLTVRQALRRYSKAVWWSAMMAMIFFMNGYSQSQVSSLFAFPAFQRRFGELEADGSYRISAAWQGGLINSEHCGEVVGLLLAGLAAEQLGLRRSIMAALALSGALLFLKVFAPGLPLLLLAEVLLSVPAAVYECVAMTYAAEVLPAQLRAQASAGLKLNGVLGSLTDLGMFRGMLDAFASRPGDEWSFRTIWAAQWLFPVPLLVGCFFAPESPWWLVRRGRLHDAKGVLRRLRSPRAPDLDGVLRTIVATNKHEAEKSGADTGTGDDDGNSSSSSSSSSTNTRGTGYLDCFRGVNLRRTEVCCMSWLVHIFCGLPLIGYSTVFLESTELSSSEAFNIGLVRQSLSAVGVVISWFLMARYGRRSIYLYGLVVMLAFLLAIGALGCLYADMTAAAAATTTTDADTEKRKDPQPLLWSFAAMFVLIKFAYDCSIGPVGFALVAELPSTRLRQKTVVLARLLSVVVATGATSVTPFMFKASEWNWGARTAFFWAGSCALCAVWSFFRLPEPKGRSYGELDLLFEHRVRARDFSRTDVGMLSTESGDDEDQGKRRMSSEKESEVTKMEGEVALNREICRISFVEKGER